MRNRGMLLVVIALSMALPLAAVAQSEGAAQTPVTPGISHALRISSGDLLDVAVFDTPELSGKLRVSANGEVAVPVAGAVRVAGMTSEEAAAAIEAKLRNMNILNDPHVSIFMNEYATQGVTVAGEVKLPGVYPLLGSHGMLDLIAAAGGPSPTAGKAVTVTHKSDPQNPEVALLNSKPGATPTNVDILPGDTITVSRCGVVYVMGDVVKPGGYLIENNDRLTVLQAIAMAQGTNRTAAQDKARLIRKTAQGPEEVKLSVKRILKLQDVDPMVEDGDVLFIPSSEARNLAYRSIEATIAVASGLILYTYYLK